MSTTAASTAAAQQAITAQRAMGPIVRVEPEVWLDIAATAANRVAVHAVSGVKLFGIKQRYLINAHGLYFVTDHTEPLRLPADLVTIEAKSIYIP